jgi:hypothetical protein
VRWRFRWPLWERAKDTTAEARAQLRRLEARDEKVAELGKELRETQRRNNFSGMVARALARGAREGP